MKKKDVILKLKSLLEDIKSGNLGATQTLLKLDTIWVEINSALVAKSSKLMW